jgi:hypothetical protein
MHSVTGEGIAIYGQRAYAGSMLRPLVLPKVLVIALIVFPVCAHIREEVRSPGCR